MLCFLLLFSIIIFAIFIKNTINFLVLFCSFIIFHMDFLYYYQSLQDYQSNKLFSYLLFWMLLLWFILWFYYYYLIFIIIFLLFLLSLSLLFGIDFLDITPYMIQDFTDNINNKSERYKKLSYYYIYISLFERFFVFIIYGYFVLLLISIINLSNKVNNIRKNIIKYNKDNNENPKFGLI